MRCLACIARVTSRGYADFVFTFGLPSGLRYYSIPPIASGRITRGRLASYWLDGVTYVPMTFGDYQIEDNPANTSDTAAFARTITLVRVNRRCQRKGVR
jgi:hypothetical protein